MVPRKIESLVSILKYVVVVCLGIFLSHFYNKTLGKKHFIQVPIASYTTNKNSYICQMYELQTTRPNLKDRHILETTQHSYKKQPGPLLELKLKDNQIASFVVPITYMPGNWQLTYSDDKTLVLDFSYDRTHGINEMGQSQQRASFMLNRQNGHAVLNRLLTIRENNTTILISIQYVFSCE